MKNITRKVRAVPSGSQQFLFDPGPATSAPPTESEKRSIRFVDRDPRLIRIGGHRLDAYLQSIGDTDVFRVRHLLRQQDWSAFQARYSFKGRSPYAPAAMMGIILYGIMNGVDSLRGLERMAGRDLSCMWLSGGIVPDHSKIGRFILLHGEELSGEFFENLTRSILERTGGQCIDLSGDGTVIQAMGSRYKRLSEEAAAEAATAARAKASAKPDNAELQEKASHAEKVAEVASERAEQRRQKGRNAKGGVVCPTEPDAVIQPTKENLVAPSYKPSVLANDQQIVVGYEVTPSNESDAIAPMVEQAERIGGEALERMKLDAGYCNEGILQYSLNKNIDLLCPEGRTDGYGDKGKSSKKQFPKRDFKYIEESDEYECPGGQRMKPIRRRKGSKTSKPCVEYKTGECGACPLRERCTKAKTGRSILRYAGDELKEAMREVMKQPRAMAVYRQRQAEAEPVYSSVKIVQGLKRFRRRGLVKVGVEYALHMMAHNLRRMLGLGKKAAAALRGTDGCCGDLLRHSRRLAGFWLPMALGSQKSLPHAKIPRTRVIPRAA